MSIFRDLIRWPGRAIRRFGVVSLLPIFVVVDKPHLIDVSISGAGDLAPFATSAAVRF